MAGNGKTQGIENKSAGVRHDHPHDSPAVHQGGYHRGATTLVEKLETEHHDAEAAYKAVSALHPVLFSEPLRYASCNIPESFPAQPANTPFVTGNKERHAKNGY